MAVNETIVTGRKFRKLTDAASKKWQRISFWHKASDCEFNDGKTAEEKLGAIKGITTDLNVTVPGYAADATRVSELNNSLNGCSFEQEGEDFYITGADSVRKKLGNSSRIDFSINTTGNGEGSTSASIQIPIPNGYTKFYCPSYHNGKHCIYQVSTATGNLRFADSDQSFAENIYTVSPDINKYVFIKIWRRYGDSAGTNCYLEP